MSQARGKEKPRETKITGQHFRQNKGSPGFEQAQEPGAAVGHRLLIRAKQAAHWGHCVLARRLQLKDMLPHGWAPASGSRAGGT